MARKKHMTVSESSLNVDLKSIIHENSLFFDKLVELIPARFYLPTDDKDKPWFAGLSKNEKALAKKESRENIKKARRERLDPEKSSASTLDLLKQNLEKEKSKDENNEDETEIKPVTSGLEDNDRSVTYEELRERLHRKIEELRGGRNSGSSDGKKRKNETKDIRQSKRKRDSGSDEKKPTTSVSEDKMEKDVDEAAKELTFSRIKLGNEEEHGRKKKKFSKLKKLEKAKSLEAAKMDPEKGEIVSKKHAWKAATSRAAGIKIHDDPKLLKQSIKKEKKKHQKNVGKWKERVETTEKLKAEKQKKRSHNISERIQEKKMRRIAKREKKLMRPGFEGRKEGFINASSN
ncbi:putative Caldesmon [Tripterygium wilfordii]|uniref:Putative Caldesmon n=1 Tax=Tripterygium wilfordii TaxID=458696 RepID=A0A7J7CX74_TRIWF|nr:surfeit locus protein 6 homolog [Tripterygium wilfordii]KAF5738539.1 putative Caldesmon [Tripterygium wilfordii]